MEEESKFESSIQLTDIEEEKSFRGRGNYRNSGSTHRPSIKKKVTILDKPQVHRIQKVHSKYESGLNEGILVVSPLTPPVRKGSTFKK